MYRVKKRKSLLVLPFWNCKLDDTSAFQMDPASAVCCQFLQKRAGKEVVITLFTWMFLVGRPAGFLLHSEILFQYLAVPMLSLSPCQPPPPNRVGVGAGLKWLVSVQMNGITLAGLWKDSNASWTERKREEKRRDSRRGEERRARWEERCSRERERGAEWRDVGRGLDLEATRSAIKGIKRTRGERVEESGEDEWMRGKRE